MTSVAEEVQGVNYEMLQDLLRSERRSNKLMPVTTRFWPEVRTFLETVTQNFRVEQAKDPFSRRVMMLSDEVKNAKHAAESLWALRERKLSMLALAATKERKTPEGITPDEGALYHDLLALLGDVRERIFEGTIAAPSMEPAPVLVPSPAPPTAQPALQLPIAEKPVSPVVTVPPPRPASTLASPINVPSDTTAPVAMVTIRALGDIPPFVGPDMQTYLLKTGDIATVPPSIANLLVKRNKASVIEAS